MLRNLPLKAINRGITGQIRQQSTVPSLSNLGASWKTLSTEERQSVYTEVVEKQKQDWKQLSIDEKRAGEVFSISHTSLLTNQNSLLYIIWTTWTTHTCR